MEHVSGAAGATLGYIGGNIPGAYLGYRLGRMAFRYRRRTSGRSSRSFGGVSGRTRAMARVVQRSGRNAQISRMRGTTNSRPITGESDWAPAYRYRRMPRFRKRTWRRFTKRVQAVNQRQTAPNFDVRVSADVATNAANGQAVTSIHTILGSFGAGPSTDDINYLLQTAVLNADDEGPTPVTHQQLKIVVTGWMIETQIINEGTVTAYVDMYYWRCKRDNPATTLGQPAVNTISQLFSESVDDIAQNRAVAAGLAKLTHVQYGVTPFQGAEFPKTIRIYKKVRVKLAPGGVTQIEQRSARNYYINGSFAEKYSMLRGKTEGIMFIHYGVPTSVNTVSSPVTLRFVTNKNYTWRMYQDNRMKGMHQL